MEKLKVGDRVRVLEHWSGEGFITKIYFNGQYEVQMVTGPFISLGEGAFKPNEVELVKPEQPAQTEMKILKIKRSTQKTGLKIYGKVLGESGKEYNFAYIRRAGFRGWICSCENFFFSMLQKNRNCKHLHFVRQQLGRYGAKVAR